MNLRSSHTTAWDWLKKWVLPINPTKCKHLTTGREVPPTLSVYPDESSTTIPVSKYVKDLGVQTGNVFSQSAQGSEAANKARRLIILVRRSFQGLSNSPFIRLCGALVCMHPKNGVPSMNHWVESCVHSQIPTTNYHHDSHNFVIDMLPF